MILNFFYICESVSLLTFLLKFNKYRDILVSGWYIFLISFGDIPRMFVHKLKIFLNFLYVCQSVSWFTFLLKFNKYRDISCSGWDICLKFFGDILEMFVHFFQINFLYVCKSISWLTYLLILSQYRDISCSGWDIFLKFLETFLRCFYTNHRKIQFFVCLSVC